MTIVERPVGDVTVLELAGRLVLFEGEGEFRSKMDELVAKDRLKIVVDLQGVSYIDSAAIGCLMDIHRLLQDKDGALRLSGLQPRVETMISMTGVHKIVGIHREEAAALASFGKARQKGKGDA